MKNFLVVVITAVVIVMLLAIPQARAAGTCTVSYADEGNWVKTVTFACTADSADASFPSTATRPIRGWVYLAETNPGTTSPTDNYDITLTNSEGVDIFGGALTNRDETNTERAVPLLNSSPYPCWVNGALTMAVTALSNAVNSATFTLKVWYYMEP